MGGCSGSSNNSATIQCLEGNDRVLQLVKVDSIEEANRLLKEEDYIYLGVFWNNNLSREEYLLGRMDRVSRSDRRVGFMMK